MALAFAGTYDLQADLIERNYIEATDTITILHFGSNGALVFNTTKKSILIVDKTNAHGISDGLAPDIIGDGFASGPENYQAYVIPELDPYDKDIALKQIVFNEAPDNQWRYHLNPAESDIESFVKMMAEDPRTHIANFIGGVWHTPTHRHMPMGHDFNIYNIIREHIDGKDLVQAFKDNHAEVLREPRVEVAEAVAELSD